MVLKKEKKKTFRYLITQKKHLDLLNDKNKQEPDIFVVLSPYHSQIAHPKKNQELSGFNLSKLFPSGLHFMLIR